MVVLLGRELDFMKNNCKVLLLKNIFENKFFLYYFHCVGIVQIGEVENVTKEEQKDKRKFFSY